MKYSEGLVLINSRSSSPMLKGELVNERSSGARQSERLFIDGRSSSACVEGRARQ